MTAAGALLRAVRQVGDPAFLGVVVRSALLAAFCFVGLALLSAWSLHHVFAQRGLLADAVAALGGATAFLLALWLFLPVAALIATLFVEPVCRAVERRWYPGLPAPTGAGLGAQMADAVGLGVRLLALSLIGLVVTLVLPGVGFFVGQAINGWAIGRGLFASVAMRRMPRADALALYRRSRSAVLPDGIALAFASVVPLLNLLVPVIGTASMVHLVERARSSARNLDGVA